MPNIDITDDITDVIPDGGTADVTDDSTPDQPIDSDVDDDADREPDDYDQTDAEDMGTGGDPIPSDSTPPAEELPEPVPTARTLTQAEYISDYSAASLAAYEQSGAVPYAVYDDGTERQVAWADVSDPTPAPVVIESEAAEVAAATNQHFWQNSTDSSTYGGAGVHVTDDEKDAWVEAVAAGFPDIATKPWHNILINSLGILLRRGLRNLVSITKSAIAFFDGEGNDAGNVVAQFGRDGAQIGRESSDHVTIDSGGLKAYKADGTPALVNSVDIAADHARIGSIEADTADIETIRANSGKVANLTAEQLEADHAKVGKLDTDYAKIDLANVNNAYIRNGAFDKAAVFDATVFDLTGDKATIKEINAANINVVNLNAKNLTVETADGYVTIGDKKTPTKEYLDSLKDELQQEIDGAIETFTVDHVPTLENAPASAWADNKEKAKHVGDVAYVVNDQIAQNGYCYRFTLNGTTFSWQLIKDSDVTAALSRLQTAEGKIGTIEQFDEQMATFKTETEGSISTLQTKTTTLETSLGDKVSTATFNEVKQTADSNRSTITQLATTLGTNADGTSKAGDVMHRVSSAETAIEQTSEAIGLSASGMTTIANPNLSPFWSIADGDLSYWSNKNQGYYSSELGNIGTQLADGWAHFEMDNSAREGSAYVNFHCVVDQQLAKSMDHTFLVEVRNLSFSSGSRLRVQPITSNESAARYDQFATKNPMYVDVTVDGSYRIAATTVADYSPCKMMCDGYFYVVAGVSCSFDIRLSLYEGEYAGPYKPYVGTKLYASQAELKVTNDAVSSKVSTTDYNGETVASLINQSADSVKIRAEHIEVTGEAVFSAINDDTGTTKINGGKIDTESITIGPSQVTGLVDALKSTYVSIVTTALDYEAGTATLEATLYVDGAATTSNVTYEWLRDGSAISGATNRTLNVIAALGLEHAYSCKVTY